MIDQTEIGERVQDAYGRTGIVRDIDTAWEDPSDPPGGRRRHVVRSSRRTCSPGRGHRQVRGTPSDRSASAPHGSPCRPTSPRSAGLMHACPKPGSRWRPKRWSRCSGLIRKPPRRAQAVASAVRSTSSAIGPVRRDPGEPGVRARAKTCSIQSSAVPALSYNKAARDTFDRYQPFTVALDDGDGEVPHARLPVSPERKGGRDDRQHREECQRGGKGLPPPPWVISRAWTPRRCSRLPELSDGDVGLL